MPPKIQFTKEQIVDAAFEIAKVAGMDSITTRAVADKMGSSTAPIYVNFKEVDELKQAVIQRVFKLSHQMLREQLGQNTPFLDIGLASLRFAREYSVLFRELIMRPNPYMNDYEPELTAITQPMQEDPDLVEFSEEELQVILLKMRIFTVGLSVMVANGLLPPEFNEAMQQEIMESAGHDVVVGMLALKKEQVLNE